MKYFLKAIKPVLLDLFIIWPWIIVAVALQLPVSEGLGNVLTAMATVLFVVMLVAAITLKEVKPEQIEKLPTEPMPSWRMKYIVTSTFTEAFFMIYFGWFFTAIMWVLATLFYLVWRSEALEMREAMEAQIEAMHVQEPETK